MPRSAHVAVWLGHLARIEGDAAAKREDAAEAERLDQIRGAAYELAAELAGTTEAAMFFAAMDAWDLSSIDCVDCGEDWDSMRRDGESTVRALDWQQTLERRTCSCGRTRTRVIAERDVQHLTDPVLASLATDRESCFSAERDVRPSEAPHA